MNCDTIRVDRTGRDSELVKNPALTLVLTTQPSVLGELGHKPGFRDRGLLARFLPSIPASILGYRNVRNPCINPRTRANYHNLIVTLVNLTGQHEGKARISKTLVLTSEAKDYFYHIQERIEHALRPEGALSSIPDWGGKRAGTTLRIAGILHAAEFADTAWPNEIDTETLKAADAIMEYYQQQAFIMFCMMGKDSRTSQAQHVLKHIKEKEITEISARDLYQGVRGIFTRMEDLIPILDILVTHHYLLTPIETEHTGPGRRPSPLYKIHPEILSQYSHNTQNNVIQANFEDNVNIV